MTNLIFIFLSIVIQVGFSFNTLNRLISRADTSTRSMNTLNMKLIDHIDALLFDCDGVIAETERDVHRISFNQAFKHKGLTNEWDVELYGELLKIGGGKERMTGKSEFRISFFDECIKIIIIYVTLSQGYFIQQVCLAYYSSNMFSTVYVHSLL